MLHVGTKKILVYYAFVNVIFNGVLKLAGTVKIRGFGTFSRWKSRGGGYRVRYGRTLKLSVRRRSCVVYIYYVKRHRVGFYEPVER
jgi:hypothetical protein